MLCSRGIILAQELLTLAQLGSFVITVSQVSVNVRPNYNDGVKCDEKRMVSAVLNCYCVTEVNSKMYVGLCFYITVGDHAVTIVIRRSTMTFPTYLN